MIASSTFGMFSVSPVPRLTSDKYFKINFVDSVFPAPDSPLQNNKKKQNMVGFIINLCPTKFPHIILLIKKIKNLLLMQPWHEIPIEITVQWHSYNTHHPGTFESEPKVHNKEK